MLAKCCFMYEKVVSSLFRVEKDYISIVVDGTSTGALLPGEANLTQTQTVPGG